MKQAALSLLLLIFGLPAFAGGDSIGHGGVLWACQSGSGGRELHSARLVDTFEGEFQYGWPMITDPSSDPMVVYRKRKEWLARELPELYESLKPRFEYVETHQSMVNVVLLPTRDYNVASQPLPDSCPQGEWKPVNFANFREEDQQVLIRNDFWLSPKISAVDKAALLFHEAVYYWMRASFAAVNSDKARKVTGVLFSALPTTRIKDVLVETLGANPYRPDAKFICVMKNTKRNQVYVAFERDMDTASIAVRMRCQDDVDSGSCDVMSIECEEFVAGPERRCLAENSKSRKVYLGRGRNQLEAQFGAHMACYIGSQAQGVPPQLCPAFVFMQCN